MSVLVSEAAYKHSDRTANTMNYLESIDALASKSGTMIPWLLFAVAVVVLLGVAVAILARIARSLGTLSYLAEDIHRDLMSFKSTAELGRSIDLALADIRGLVRASHDEIEQARSEMSGMAGHLSGLRQASTQAPPASLPPPRPQGQASAPPPPQGSARPAPAKASTPARQAEPSAEAQPARAQPQPAPSKQDAAPTEAVSTAPAAPVVVVTSRPVARPPSAEPKVAQADSDAEIDDKMNAAAAAVSHVRATLDRIAGAGEPAAGDNVTHLRRDTA